MLNLPRKKQLSFVIFLALSMLLPAAFVFTAAAPVITFVAPTPADGSHQQTTSVSINVTVSDSDGISTCYLTWEDVNFTMTETGSGTKIVCNYTQESLTDGTYIYKVIANDTLDTFSETPSRSVTIDTTNPLIAFVPPTPANGTSTTSSQWNSRLF